MILYVNKVEIGEYESLCSDYKIDLKTEVYVNEEIVIYQVVYYSREFADFFTLYVYEDSDNNIADLYLIDSREIDKNEDDLREYHAVKITEDIEWHELIIRMIKESIEE